MPVSRALQIQADNELFLPCLLIYSNGEVDILTSRKAIRRNTFGFHCEDRESPFPLIIKFVIHYTFRMSILTTYYVAYVV